MVPYSTWLSSGDNAWQMTAATLVGLMSIPALAVLYGGIVQRKWAINTTMMVFCSFALTLIVWVLWAFKMGFGSAWIGTFIGKPGTVVGASGEQAQAHIPLLNGLMPKFRIPQSSLVYFQFVFAAITPILFIGSVIGRIKFKVWLIFVPLWITFAYAVNAFLLWGGGFWAGKGALDFSGGYVIHLAPACQALSPLPWSGRGSSVIASGRCLTTCFSSRSAPAFSGWAGMGSTAATRTSLALTPAPR